MRIYVASSWRNPYQPEVVELLRKDGHEVYDFRNPAPGNTGFAWSNIDPEWLSASGERFARMLEHPVAEAGFALDMNALRWCEACIMVQPCGVSAALELGWAAGAGKRTAVYLVKGEPELMFKVADLITARFDEICAFLRKDAIQ